MSYEFYKIFHLISLFFLIFLAGGSLRANAQEKWEKILSGVLSFFVLVSGMGLLARIGVSHGEPWPLWAMLKVVLWLVLTISAPVVLKRFTSFVPKYRFIYPIIVLVAVYVIILKPEL